MDGLTQKWHGLPIWAWIIIAGVGLYLLSKLRSNIAANNAATSNTSGTEPTNTSANNSVSNPSLEAGTYSGHNFTAATEPGTAVPTVNPGGTVQYS